ncbi:hypothetical protein A2246_02865 [candidate division WOR-1 bacterium RIFOXYA2_FULL_37_7]|uniref:Uncharacterized protein n=1 Tax=candidate division WOR-1 bacterium RIFOXYB2_FULL_37_13 TaxID=1802579 RepID=A0A1F4SF27_UNCSA|nr:MAG: hypothetical protein A2246_02865 [candidate division WOR-1 bacterium RIFOXYA2_FULL_37_7]OGC19026.1 MAG: hypothetical protein A2310_03330 [candidate division WOR-1 bacterium RIFOXYB2_FULL_37_13]
MEDDKLIEAIENVRRDKSHPWRYLVFTFLNGIAYGVGLGIGMTVILGLVLFFITKIIAGMVNFPLIGHYFNEVAKIIETYSSQGARIR